MNIRCMEKLSVILLIEVIKMLKNLFLFVPAKRKNSHKIVNTLLIEQLCDSDRDNSDAEHLFYYGLTKKGLDGLMDFADFYFDVIHAGSMHIISPYEIGAVMSADYLMRVSQNYGCKATYGINNHVSAPFCDARERYNDSNIAELVDFISAESSKANSLILFSSAEVVRKLSAYYSNLLGKDISIPLFSEGEGIHFNFVLNKYQILYNEHIQKRNESVDELTEKHLQKVRAEVIATDRYFSSIEDMFKQEPLFLVYFTNAAKRDQKYLSPKGIGRIRNMRPYGDDVDTNEINVDFAKKDGTIENWLVFLQTPDKGICNVLTKDELTKQQRLYLRKAHLLD